MKGCNGRCLAGVIVAIIFGALFIWTLVIAYQTQLTDLWNYNVLPWYLLALVFLAVAKGAKHWAMGCPHCESESPKSEKKK